MEAGSCCVALTLLLVAIAPAAGAASIQASLATAEPLLVDGAFTATLPGAAVRAYRAPLEPLEHEWVGLDGRFILYEWRVANSTLGAQPLGEPTRETFDVTNATLLIRVSAEEAHETHARLEAGGRATLSGPARARVDATRLAAPFQHSVGVTLLPEAERIPFELQAGDALFGQPTRNLQLAALEPWERPALALEGPLAFHVQGGNATLREGDGPERTLRLSKSEERANPLAPLQIQTWRLLVFEGEVARATINTGAEWAVGGPDVAWHTLGTTSFSRATGWIEVDGQRTEVHDANVRLEGSADITPHAPTVGALLPDRYESAGDGRVFVDGRAATAPPSAAPVALAGLAALLATALAALTDTGRQLAGRAFALFYTRLTPERLLDHPTRRRLHDVVTQQPGIHLREAHRQLGGAWGPFKFHLGMLVQAGHLRIHEEGQYRSIHPAGHAHPNATPIRSATARKLLDVIPADGTKLPVSALRGQLGISRQRLDYHLRGLAERGLVQIEAAETERVVRREPGAPPS